MRGRRYLVRMVDLSSRQRAHLRSLAHHLDPVVHVGAAGVTEATLRSVDDAFNTRELLKVRVQQAAPEPPRDAGAAIAAGLAAVHHVQTIGRVVVLYRPDPEEPTIRLP